MGVTTVEDHIGIMSRPICSTELQEGFDLCLQSLQEHPTGGVIAAEILNQVVGEEALHVVQHAGGTHVQLLHLTWRQQHGLAIRTTRETKQGS